MGRIGIGELLVIAVIGYFILGPEKLPALIRKVSAEYSKLMKEIRND